MWYQLYDCPRWLEDVHVDVHGGGVERSALVITPGPQMDPEKPGVDHLVEVGRLPLPGVTGTAGLD